MKWALEDVLVFVLLAVTIVLWFYKKMLRFLELYTEAFRE